MMAPKPEALAALTDHRRAIAELVAQGMSNKEIAARLGPSVRTIENTVLAMMAKLGCRNRVQLAVMLREQQVAELVAASRALLSDLRAAAAPRNERGQALRDAMRAAIAKAEGRA